MILYDVQATGFLRIHHPAPEPVPGIVASDGILAVERQLGDSLLDFRGSCGICCPVPGHP